MTNAGLLQRILQAKRAELPELRRRRLPSPPVVRPAGLRREQGQPLRLIAEIKRRSPSAGALSTELSVPARAVVYQRAGAHMMSVLCDWDFFGGRYEDLAAARAATELPVLCKEFVLDECQLDAARAYGASAVLLIVRCLAPERLHALVRGARERELLPFVEVVTEGEARLALETGATCIGVNARDLDTLRIDLARADRVLEGLPASVIRVHLSGISGPEQVRKVAERGLDAALMGEALMRQADPEALLRSFVEASDTAALRGRGSQAPA